MLTLISFLNAVFLSTTYRETHSIKWTLRLALFFTGSALVLSCIIYHVAEIFLS